MDGYLVSTKDEDLLEHIKLGIEMTFEVGSWKQVPNEMYVNSTEVVQTKESVTVWSDAKVKTVSYVVLSPGRRKYISAESMAMEKYKVRSMAGKHVHIGGAV